MAQLAGERVVAAVSRVLRLPSAHVSPGAAPSFAAASMAAMLMLATAAALGVLVPAATGQFHYFQPSERPGDLEDLVRPTNEYSGAAVAYFTIDSGFVIAFAAVFVGLFVLTRSRAPQFARFALGAGLWTAIADVIENALYWTYAMRAQAGVVLVEFDTPLLPVLSNVKMVGFFATYLAFALILPRRDWLERFTAGVMLLPPTIGLASMGIPVLGDLRPLLLAAPSLPLIVVFARAWSAGVAADRTTAPA